MESDRELLLRITAQARKLSGALESACAQDWADEKARLDALLSCAPHSLIVAADIAADLHAQPTPTLPPHLTT